MKNHKKRKFSPRPRPTQQVQNRRKYTRSRRSNKPSTRCTRCNSTHKDHEKCPSVGKTCNLCKKLNHYAVCCKIRKAVHEIWYDGQGSTWSVTDSSFFLGSVTNCSDKEEPWEVKLEICCTPATYKINTGADMTIISKESYNTLEKQPRLQPVYADYKLTKSWWSTELYGTVHCKCFI